MAIFVLDQTTGSQRQRQEMGGVCQGRWSAGAAHPGNLERMNELLTERPCEDPTPSPTEPLAVVVVYEDSLTGARATQVMRDLRHMPTDEESLQCKCPDRQCSREEIVRRAETVTCVLTGILNYNPGVPRWGINE